MIRPDGADAGSAIELDPESNSGFNLRAALHYQLGNYPAALEDHLKAHDLKPDDAGTLNFLAWIRATAAALGYRPNITAAGLRTGRSGLVGVLAPDIADPGFPPVLGGVTEWMKVAAMAQAHDLDVAPHGSQDIHIHLVSAISNGLILEFYRDSVDPMWGKIYHHTLRVNADGTVSPPEVLGPRSARFQIRW